MSDATSRSLSLPLRVERAAIRGFARLPQAVIARLGAGAPVNRDGERLAPEVAAALRVLNRIPGSDFSTKPIDAARRQIEEESLVFADTFPPFAVEEDLLIPSAHGSIPATRYRAEGGGVARARRLLPRRRLGPREPGEHRLRRTVPRSSCACGRAVGRLPPRAGAPVPRRDRGRARGMGVCGRASAGMGPRPDAHRRRGRQRRRQHQRRPRPRAARRAGRAVPAAAVLPRHRPLHEAPLVRGVLRRLLPHRAADGLVSRALPRRSRARPRSARLTRCSPTTSPARRPRTWRWPGSTRCATRASRTRAGSRKPESRPSSPVPVTSSTRSSTSPASARARTRRPCGRPRPSRRRSRADPPRRRPVTERAGGPRTRGAPGTAPRSRRPRA